MRASFHFVSTGLVAGALMTAALAASSAQAAAPAWAVDKARSKLGFDSSFSGTKFSGAFQQWDASITFDPKDLATSKAVVSVNVVSAKTGDNDRDTTAPTADWFNVAKFPRATYTTSSIKAVGPNKYLASGILSLKGISKPVALPFTLTINGNVATMTGSVAIDRSQWGVGEGQFAGEDTVPHAVTVQIAITALKK